METYRVSRTIGEGNYTHVVKAVHLPTKALVAIKTMKRSFQSWDECLALKELQSLRKVTHPHITSLKAVIRDKQQLHVVYDYMETNCLELMERKSLEEPVVRKIIYQILKGLAHVHSLGMVHRDIRPEHFMISPRDTAQLSGFGLCREVNILAGPMSEYVSARWYRAPEVLLKAQKYDTKVDIWGVGCVLAELLAGGHPLLPGASEADQLYKISKLRGNPCEKEGKWKDAKALLAQQNITLPNFPSKDLQEVLPSVSKPALELLDDLLCWNPSRRPTAQQALSFKWFNPDREGALKLGIIQQPILEVATPDRKSVV